MAKKKKAKKKVSRRRRKMAIPFGSIETITTKKKTKKK